jgi:hypothetical protein
MKQLAGTPGNSFTNNSFKFFTLAVLLVLLLPQVFRQGLFMDGLMYSAIANNLSYGDGSLWFPKFYGPVQESFHDHPPLAFGLQAVTFTIFGHAFYIEKLHAFCIALLTGWLIKKCWQKLSVLPHLWWLPVLLWISTERVFWCFNNNMLENTMCLFSLVAFYFLLLASGYTRPRKFIFILLAALALVLGFLSKGFPALFPLGFFVVYAFAYYNNYRFKTALPDTILLWSAFAGLILLLFMFNGDAYKSISMYINTQVVNSVSGNDRVGSRWPFISGFFQQLAAPIGLFICAAIYHKKPGIFLSEVRPIKNVLLLTLFTGLSAFVPLLVSPKLSFYYLVPSFPYFALMFALLTGAFIQNLTERVESQKRVKHIFRLVSYAVIFFTFGYTILNYGEPVRDKQLLADIDKIAGLVPSGSRITISSTVAGDWSLLAYLQRNHRILPVPDASGDFFLVSRNDSIQAGYTESRLPLADYRLLRKR